jgi:Bacteriophage HK97-gp10, putative tail-component
MALKVEFQWTGLEEFKAQMQALPAQLTTQADGIVRQSAELAAMQMRARYPAKTGNLRRGVQVRYRRSAARTTALVQNIAPHAHIYESGTVARHYTGTDKLGRRYVMGARGSMPPGHVFWPIYYTRRRMLFLALKDLLRGEGLLVSGEAA